MGQSLFVQYGTTFVNKSVVHGQMDTLYLAPPAGEIRQGSEAKRTARASDHAARSQKNDLIFKHIEQRQQLNLRQRSELSRRDLEIEQLKQDIH